MICLQNVIIWCSSASQNTLCFSGQLVFPDVVDLARPVISGCSPTFIGGFGVYFPEQMLQQKRGLHLFMCKAFCFINLLDIVVLI